MNTSVEFLRQHVNTVEPSEHTQTLFRQSPLVVFTNEILGTGKTTITRRLAQKAGYMAIPSWATREMRTGESQGDPYRFVSPQDLAGAVQGGDVVELGADPSRSRFYATHIEELTIAARLGVVPIKDIETAGFTRARSLHPGLRAVVLTPCLPRRGEDRRQDTWTRRIYDREGVPATWSSEKLQDMRVRFSAAAVDAEERLPRYLQDSNVLFVPNDNLGKTLSTVDAWIRGELPSADEAELRRLAVDSLAWAAQQAWQHLEDLPS